MRATRRAVRGFATLLGVLAAALALAGLAGAATVHVHITLGGADAKMDPDPANAVPGDTVVWHNHDAAPHTATEDGGAWDTGNLLNGQSKELVFGSAGSWTYYCAVHPTTMKGFRLVVNTKPSLAITDPAPEAHVPAGQLTVRGTASDADGNLASVAVRVDGNTVGVGGTESWSATFDTGPHGTQHTIVATVTDALGGTDSRTIRITVNAPPVAGFSVTPAAPTSADIVQFHSTTTDDHQVNTHTWDFGDGSPASPATNATHRFAKGAYTVKLTVVDDHGASANATRALTVANSAPRANFTTSPADPAKGEPVAFTDRTEDFDRDATTWAWQFGDGATSALRNATHTYAAPGTYAVNLTVTDAEGASSTFHRVLEVSEFATQRPVARLSANPPGGVAPVTVTFSLGGHDPDGTVHNWSLDFGDGSPRLTGPGSLLANNATHAQGHTYQRNGTFEVVFTVRDNVGATGTNRTTVVVDPPPNRPPQVRFEVAPTTTPRKGQVVQFADASKDLDFEDAVVSWDWDFGDGARSCCDKPRVSHAYTRVGRVVATLTVSDTLGAKSTVPLTLDVQGEAPRVLLAVNATQGRAPMAVNMTLDARDSDGRVERWVLDFGDGTPPRRGEGPPPARGVLHVYDAAGTFAATLDAFDEDGLSGRSVVTVVVGARAPEPVPLPPGAIAASPAGTRFTYRFAATSAMPGEITYQWAFGDGRTATGKEVTYSYQEAGTYTVTLTLLGPGGPVARGSLGIGVGEESTGPRERLRSEVASGVVRVAWTPDPRAGGYQVWKAGADGRFEEVAVVASASHYDDLEVEDGQPYAYQVTFYSPDGSGRLRRLSELGATEAYRRLGQVQVTGLVDSDGDGVGDTRDAFPFDSTRSVAPASPLLPALGLLAVAAAGAVAWRYREPLRARLGGGAPPGSLAAIPGLDPQQAAVLASAGVRTTRLLAVADPADLARRTVLPRAALEHWVAVAQLLQLPGLPPREADLLAKAGVRGPWELARADPAALAQRVPGVPLARAQRWVRTARRATSAS